MPLSSQHHGVLDMWQALSGDRMRSKVALDPLRSPLRDVRAKSASPSCSNACADSVSYNIGVELNLDLWRALLKAYESRDGFAQLQQCFVILQL